MRRRSRSSSLLLTTVRRHNVAARAAAWACLAWLAGTVSVLGQNLPRFQEHVLHQGMKMGYQLVAVDLTGDGKKDVIALDEAATELAWLENQHPRWVQHVMAVGVPRPINAAAADVDGDGKPEVALAYRFSPSPIDSVGNVVLIRSGDDVRKPWAVREIDRVPTAHRVRWLDPEGKGKKVLVVAPLVGRRHPPQPGDPAPIYLYRPGSWKRELLSDAAQGVLHAIHPVTWGDARGQQLLAASYLGLQRLERSDGRWAATLVAHGDPRPWPLSGTSEVRVGRLGGLRFLTTIEPFHGNQVVVYLPAGDGWKRIVIEEGMENGHALGAGDLDGDGRDEIVASFRGKGRRLSIYQSTDAEGKTWKKTVLDDGGIAGADCVIEDFTGDGRPDIVSIGASTGNVKLYESRLQKR